MSEVLEKLDPVNVVVIENNPQEVMLIREAFELWTRPHRLAFFQNGGDGLTGLRQPSDGSREATLVLLDWNLVGMHGSKVLQEIREDPALQKSFVVVLTASSSEIDRQLAQKLGANRFLTKAIDVDDFFYSLLELQTLL